MKQLLAMFLFIIFAGIEGLPAYATTYTLQCIGGGTVESQEPPGQCNKCWTIQCVGGGTNIVGFPEYCGDNPPANAICNNSQPSPNTPNAPYPSPCPTPGNGIVGSLNYSLCKQYWDNHSLSPTPSITAVPILSSTPRYIASTSTPTPIPTIIPPSSTNQLVVHKVSPVVSKNFPTMILQYISRTVSEITSFIMHFL